MERNLEAEVAEILEQSLRIQGRINNMGKYRKEAERVEKENPREAILQYVRAAKIEEAVAEKPRSQKQRAFYFYHAARTYDRAARAVRKREGGSTALELKLRQQAAKNYIRSGNTTELRYVEIFIGRLYCDSGDVDAGRSLIEKGLRELHALGVKVEYNEGIREILYQYLERQTLKDILPSKGNDAASATQR